MPRKRRTNSVRERAIARNVVERYWEGGRGYALRIPAYGRRWYVTLGSEPEWTPERAIIERDNILADVRRGIWEPPDRNERPGAETPQPESGSPSVDANEAPTFAAFFDTYLAKRKGRVSQNMYEYEDWAIRLHLRPYFVDRLATEWRREPRVDDVTVRTVDDYVTAKVAEAERRRNAIERGRPLTVRVNRQDRVLRPLDNGSINKTLDVLQSVLNLAHDYRYVAENVAQGKRRRLMVAAKESAYIDSVDGLIAMLDAALILDRTRRYLMGGRLAMITVLIFAGPRAHELTALRWNDVDLGNAKLHIRRSKTKAGIRTIDLVPLAVRVLASYKRACSTTAPDDLVFPTGTGTARDKDNLRGRVLVPVVKLANELLRRRGQRLLSERLTPHKLRHTTASIHAALGTNPVSAKRQMGHTRYEFTLSAYSHELASDPRQRERLIKLINR